MFRALNLLGRSKISVTAVAGLATRLSCDEQHSLAIKSQSPFTF